jgi:hypothetical protein
MHNRQPATLRIVGRDVRTITSSRDEKYIRNASTYRLPEYTMCHSLNRIQRKRTIPPQEEEFVHSRSRKQGRTISMCSNIQRRGATATSSHLTQQNGAVHSNATSSSMLRRVHLKQSATMAPTFAFAGCITALCDFETHENF